MTRPDLKIVDFPHSPLHDVPTKLRELADDIEQGVYGGVGSCGVAILGNTFEVFGFGEDSAGPAIATLFHAALSRISNAIEQHGK